ncbi:MAG: gas vesicle protein GvpD [archaeon]|nr:gas vesicle protein GvpD [archaeon]
MERAKTGIIGLDELIEGGFPVGRTMLVSGGCGTGKTLFSMQYIYYGAAIYKEPGVYVTLDERPDLIRQDVMRFGWDLKVLEQKNLIALIDGSVARIGMPSEEEFSMPITGFDTDKLLLEILRVTKKIGAKRVVIDSIPALGFNFENESETRRAILKLSYMLTRAGVTSILTSEVQEGELRYGKYGVEEYIADGVIVLRYASLAGAGGTNRTIHIRKMRATKHSEDLHPLSITPKGVKIHKIDETD